MFRKKHTRLTQEGWYYLVVVAVVIVGGSIHQTNLMLLLAGMMIGAIYFNWRLVRSTLRGLTVRRRLPDSVRVGDALVVELEATGRHYGSALRIEDPIRLMQSIPSDERSQGIAIVPRVGPNQAARATYEVRFGRRGRYEFGPLRASTRYPFGLVQRTSQISQADQVIVLPRLGKLTGRWSSINREIDPGARRTARRQGLTEGDFYGLRDWRPGDSRRWIHWRTSARRGGLMVRQFEQPRSKDLTVLVELWQPSEPDEQERDNVELAVSFAATIASEACRSGGSQLLLAVAGNEFAAAVGTASMALAREVLQKLAIAEAGPSDRLEQLVKHGLHYGPPSGRLVLISTRPPTPGEAERLAKLASDPHHRSAVGRMLRLATSGDELFEFFRAE